MSAVSAGSAVMAAALCFAAQAVAAADIAVRVQGCRAPVELKARGAPLADVLARLSKALDFQLRLDGAVDAVVNVEMSAPGPELVARLAGLHGNFMIGHADDMQCPGVARVSTLWLTAKASGAAAPTLRAASDAKPRPPAVRAVTETATPERLRLVEADARRRKEAYDAYVRQHGEAPPGEPEDAARP